MFSKHIPSLYSPKPTLATLYAEDNTLFASMQFPEGLDAATVGAFLLHRYGSLDTIYKEADAAKAAFGLWAGVMLPGWEKMWEALQEEYKPLENYSMLERMTNDVTQKAYGKTTTRTDNLAHTKTGNDTNTPNLTETETPNITNARDRGVYGFNSQPNNAVPDSEETETETGTNTTTTTGTSRTDYNTTESDTGTQTAADSGTDTETRNYQLTREGNIGVTTSQQMLESEIELRCKWNMCEIIAVAFMREFCVAVW